MNVVAVIPARYGSTRFPGKPLAAICGKPMIQHVYENAAACGLLDRVVVATDNPEIADCVASFGGGVCMTASTHETGTDRIAEAVQNMEADIIVNVQGDEPLLPPDAVSEAVGPLLNDASIPLGTLKTAITDREDLDNPNVVKVVTDARGFALYFSRATIPFCREAGEQSPQYYRHIGLYVYRRDFLFAFTELPRSPLEKAESLEQLRALDHGYAVKVVETDYYPLGVDVPEDIGRVEQMMR